ncbi:hypothetical protein HNQ50_004003 [Silvimonas terrae]|uniref:Uncharacterized protein n=1 Tax=Silvimonas terrae TaxID=300266 RepID=A0A840RHX2_9NEIS|nr:hypothetical protein [Silvimonas terrae]MBB5193249.1 hypothetical protein [Silvimonas terrae]
MFVILESSKEISTAERKLEATLRREFTQNAVKKIGFRGGAEEQAQVIHNGQYWFWSTDHNAETVANPRRLHWFGLLNAGPVLQITLEINTLYEGYNNQIAGFFAKDPSSGQVYLFHSGKIGGGATGVGKHAFMIWNQIRPMKVIDSSGGIREGVLVMPVDGKAATRSAVKYIESVAKFKHEVSQGLLESADFLDKEQVWKDYFSEVGYQRTGIRSEFDYLSRHAEVVEALYHWRQSQPMAHAARIVKNGLIDLGVVAQDGLIELYEVKTSVDRSDIYQALGQLMIHGPRHACQKTIVLPARSPLPEDIRNSLALIGINIKWYRLGDTAVAFLENPGNH